MLDVWNLFLSCSIEVSLLVINIRNEKKMIIQSWYNGLLAFKGVRLFFFGQMDEGCLRIIFELFLKSIF